MLDEEPTEYKLVEKYDELRKAIILDKSRSRLTKQIQQLNCEISELQETIKKREEEIDELNRRMDELNQENKLIREGSERQINYLKTEQDQLIHDKIQAETLQLQATIKDLKAVNDRLHDHVAGLEIFAIGAITGVPNSVDNLKDYIYTRGAPEHKVLLIILERERISIAEIADKTKLPSSQVDQHLESLKKQGLIQIQNNQVTLVNTLIPAKKSIWEEIPREALMVELATFLQEVKDEPDRVAKALEDISEVLTEKYQIRGVLIYEIRSEANKWRKNQGIFQELYENVIRWQNRL